MIKIKKKVIDMFKYILKANIYTRMYQHVICENIQISF